LEARRLRHVEEENIQLCRLAPDPTLDKGNPGARNKNGRLSPKSLWGANLRSVGKP
jgi:hypothetical protein